MILKSRKIISEDGIIRWYNERGYLHRKNGPAIIYPGGFERWFIKGREIKPIPDHIILWERKLDAKK